MDTAIATPIYTVKNVKTFTGREGLGWECSLYKDGQRLGTVLDDAHGGNLMFSIDRAEEKALEDYCKTLPKRPWGFDGDDLDPEGCDVSGEIFVSDLVGDFLENRDMKKRCKTHTVFTLKDGEKNAIWSMKSLFTPKVKKHLQDKHGDNLKEIVNERYL